MLTESDIKPLIKLAVMMTNAAPGATYLAGLAAVYVENGMSLPDLARSLAASPVYKDLNPDSQTAAEFALKLLQPFGISEDHYLFAYAVGQFYASKDKGDVALKVLSIVDASSDPELANAQAVFANKVAVATYLSVTMQVTETDVGKLVNALGVVSELAASVEAAKAELDKTYGASAATLEIGPVAVNAALSTQAAVRDVDHEQLIPQGFVWRESKLVAGDSFNTSLGAEVVLAGIFTAGLDGHLDLGAGFYN